MLHWLAEARARLVPPAAVDGALLVDVGCGAGLLAPHLAGKGYRHVGVDLTVSALEQAPTHGVRPVKADAVALPLADAAADVVVAGEILEHVTDLPGTVAELCRVLRPGGLLVLDTLNATAVSRSDRRTPGRADAGRPPWHPRSPPVRGPRSPDPAVRPARGATARCAEPVPRFPPLVSYLPRPKSPPAGPIVPTRSTAVLYQGRGRKQG